eukprot:5157951-Pyramimonas_sp.AAC.1
MRRRGHKGGESYKAETEAGESEEAADGEKKREDKNKRRKGKQDRTTGGKPQLKLRRRRTRLTLVEQPVLVIGNRRAQPNALR